MFGIGAIGAALFITNLNDRVKDNDDKITKYTNYIMTLEDDFDTYNTQQTNICSGVSSAGIHKMYTCVSVVILYYLLSVSYTHLTLPTKA